MPREEAEPKIYRDARAANPTREGATIAQEAGEQPQHPKGSD